MEKTFDKIWKLALPYLKQSKIKDLVVHTKGVVKAMELLLEKENGDKNILIPAAILHDVGWSKIPPNLQKSRDEDEKHRALKLHLEFAPPIIEEILTKVDFDKNKIKEIIEIVIAHQFQDPTQLDKQLLIDADDCSDAFREQFYSDVESYNTTPEQNYNFRKKNNKFYTKTAREIFNKELEKRRMEFTHIRNKQNL